MASHDDFVVLWHGTTAKRARDILAHGPDPNYREENDPAWQGAEGFSAAPPDCPKGIFDAETFARGKANEFKDQGGPAIVEFVVTRELADMAHREWVIEEGRRAINEYRFVLPDGYDPPGGLDVLMRLWPTLDKKVILL